MQKQTHRTGTSFKQRILGAMSILRDKTSPWRKTQDALEEVAGRVFVIREGGDPLIKAHTGRVRGKANIKAAKKLTHIPGYYGKQRREPLLMGRNGI